MFCLYFSISNLLIFQMSSVSVKCSHFYCCQITFLLPFYYTESSTIGHNKLLKLLNFYAALCLYSSIFKLMYLIISVKQFIFCHCCIKCILTVINGTLSSYYLQLVLFNGNNKMPAFAELNIHISIVLNL